MAPKKDGIDDKTLREIAKALGNKDKILDLALELGFDPTKAESFIETNRMGSKVTNKGTFDMLVEWRDNVTARQQKKKLGDALKKCDFKKIADDFFGKAADRVKAGESSTKKTNKRKAGKEDVASDDSAVKQKKVKVDSSEPSPIKESSPPSEMTSPGSKSAKTPVRQAKPAHDFGFGKKKEELKKAKQDVKKMEKERDDLDAKIEKAKNRVDKLENEVAKLKVKNEEKIEKQIEKKRVAYEKKAEKLAAEAAKAKEMADKYKNNKDKA